ncbi:MAG: aldo/keto reductase [Lachnospiraceae bacterium]|nr:aldo/keto reductase [Lachnospiraceae bacterium]
MEYRTLRNQNQIPAVGLGTWQVTDRAQMVDVIGSAYEAGYRLIDTAAAYSNEIALAKAIAAHEIPREELILSDKVWNTSRGYEAVQEACKKSLKKLKTEYLDCYLIHWPASMKLYPNWEEMNADTWRGMEALYQAGLVRNIGVCNFKVHHLEALKKTAEVMPLINQVELHPGMPQEELLSYCKAEGIALEASSPLGNGQILTHEVITEIAAAHQVTPAQICLRWALAKDAIVIPKSTNPVRIRANLDVFGFTLSEEEIRRIDAMPYCGGIGIDSDEVEEFG